MRKIYTKLLWLFIAVVGLLAANNTQAQSSGIFESYAILNLNGGGNTYYDMQATTPNPDLQGANLGTFCSSNSLVLFGGQNKTFKNGGCDIINSNIWYRVYPTGSPAGTFTSINEPFDANLPTPGDQQWITTSGGGDLLAGLTVSGNYTVEIYSTADYQGCGTGTHYSSNGGSNYTATFTFNKTTGALSGTYNIPSSCYPTLASFVTALNANGVSGPVTANLLASNPQTAPVGGYVIGGAGSLILSGGAATSATNTVTFTGNGNTITAFTPQASGALNDAFFKLIGADYITIQGFALQENAANTTTTAASNNMTEFGVALLYASLTDGAQNNTIQNNTITLNRTYLNTFGIYSNTRHSATAIATSAEVTAASGSNSNNKVYGNTISNVNYGIVFIGAGTTIAAIDNGNDIGGSSAATGNTITNWGGGAALSNYVSMTGSNYCIFINQQNNDNVSYNTITSAALAQSVTTGGILKNYSAATPAAATVTTTNINNNTVTVTNNPTAATSGTIIGINSQGITTFLSTATININNNTVQNCVLGGSTATTVGLSCITNLSLPGTLNMNGNSVINNAITATSSTSAIINGIANSGAAGTVNMNNNILRGHASRATTGQPQGITNSGAVVTALNINNNQLGNASGGFFTSNIASSGGLFGISTSGGAATCAVSISGNDIRGITYTVPASAAQVYFQNTANTLSQNISNNTFTNLNINSTGSVTFLSNSVNAQAGGFKTVNGNSIVTGFNKAGAGGTIALYTDGGSSTATAGIQNNNNNFSNITVTGATTITGWFNNDGTSGTPTKTITGNVFSNWTGGTSSIIALQSDFGNPATIANNTITNISGQGAISGLVMGTSGVIANMNIANNIISGLTSTGAGGNVTGIGTAAPATIGTISRNLISGLSSTASSATVVGVSVTAGTTINIVRDTITNLSATGTTVPLVRGISATSGTITIDSCHINNFAASGTGTVTMQGINMGAVTASTTTRNNINGLLNSATGAGSLSIGYVLSGGSGTNVVSNNFISNLTASGGNSSGSVVGIHHNTTVATLKAYYNTINLGSGGALTGATNFGATGVLYPLSSSTLLDLKSNIISVNATPNGTGLAAAVRRNTSAAVANTAPVATNFDANNNIYYINAGAQNYLYVDATDNSNAKNGYAVSGLTASVPNNIVNDVNFNTSCGLYKAFMGLRETATFTENNLGAGPFPATFVPSGASYAESNGGVTSPATTTDYASVSRTTPDVGALQFSGTATDAVGPTISYTNIPNSVCLSAPTLSVTINDISGVNTTPGTAPRLYFRKGGATAEADVFGTYPNDNNSSFNGWKYVEATGTAPNFSFTIDYSLLTSPMAAGDSITYFVVAQDNNGTPNVGINAVAFPSGFCPSSVNIPASGAVPTAGSKGYRILALPSPINTIASVTTICGSGNSNLSLSTAVTGVTYQWQSSPNGSTYTDIGGATSATYAATGISATTYYQAVFLCNGSPVGNSVPVTVTVNPRPTVPVSPAGPVAICAPATQLLDASGTNAAPTVGYQWLNNNVPIGGATSATYTATVSGNYRVRIVDGVTGCFDTSAVVAVAINPIPATPTITPSSATVCAGDVQQLTASVSPVTVTLGTGTSPTSASVTTSSLGPNPLQSYYGGSKQQMLVTAAELSGLGLSAGSTISSIAFNLNAVESRTLQNYVVKMQHTSLNAFSSTSFVTTGFTTVRTAADLIPVSGWNTIPFTTNFVWDGTSNLLIETNQSNNDGGGTGTNTALYSTTAFASSLFFRGDNSTAAVVDATTTASFSAYTVRNNMRFVFAPPAPTITWSPTAGLYTDALATIAYTGTAANTVYAKNGASQTYTATNTTGGCSSSANVTVTATGIAPATVIAGVVAADGNTVESNAYAVNGTTDYLTACKAISTITPSGASPVTGSINNIVRVDTGANKMGTARLYAARYYDIMPATNPATATGTVKLYFLQSEFNNYNGKAFANNYYPLPDNGANTIDSLRILIYHGAPTGGHWPGDYAGAIDELSSASPGVSVVWNAAGNNGTGWWEVSFPANGFSGYFISSKPIPPLPIKIEYFRGAKQGGNHVLDWKVVPVNTANGVITLERSSDGRSFSSIYSITASATRMLQPFNYSTNNLLKGTNYYRLKMVDDNGVVTYSQIVALLNSSKGFELVNITPNPVTEGRFKLNISAAEQLKMEVVVTDMAGRVVSSQTNTLISGFNAIEVNVNTLAKGMYQVMGIVDGERTKAFKFVKQ